MTPEGVVPNILAKEIHLTRGYVALVSPEDYEWAQQYKWHAHLDGKGKVYAARTVWTPETKKNFRHYMHREITKAPKHLVADHRFGNGLDNQRHNLRVCTRAQNHISQQSHRDNPFGFRGVSKQPRSTRYRARIWHAEELKEITLGTFDTPEEAARAYDLKAMELHGEFAWQNFRPEHLNPKPLEGIPF